jgi:hypothetical protein
MSAPTHLERAVLHAMLQGVHPALEELRDQLHGLVVVHRNATPTSFSTWLRPARGASRAPVAAARAVLDDLHADVPDLAGFTLHHDDPERDLSDLDPPAL